MNGLSRLLPTSLSAAKALNILREVDLGAIKRDAERRFLLELSGDPGLAERLAESLSQTPGRRGVHPYLTRSDARLPADAHLIVTPHCDALPLPDTRVPVLRVCVVAHLEEPVGAELPQPGESGRVLLPSLSTQALQSVLAPALLELLPEALHLSLARQLPLLRPAVLRRLIATTSRTNALYALSTGVAEVVPVLNLPLNVADTVVLTKNQLVMAYKLALAAGKTGAPRDLMGEIVGVLGGGFVFRQAARSLVGLIPVWGIIPKVAIAYAGTEVIGTATARWATEGRPPSSEELRRLFERAFERGKQFARGALPRRTRGRAQVIDAPQDALEPPKESE